MSANQEKLERTGTHAVALYPVRKFSFPDLDGNAKKAMDTHLELYAGYVKEANGIAAALADRGSWSGVVEAIHARESLARRLAFELNGVHLHELLFEQMDSDREFGKPLPDSFLLRHISAAWGGFAGWIDDVKLLGKTRGPGWVVSSWDQESQRLNNMWIELHHLMVPTGQRLVFVLDLWEHAYWDEFGAKGRPEYIEKTLSRTDWSVVEQRLRTGIK